MTPLLRHFLAGPDAYMKYVRITFGFHRAHTNYSDGVIVTYFSLRNPCRSRSIRRFGRGHVGILEFFTQSSLSQPDCPIPIGAVEFHLGDHCLGAWVEGR